MRPAPRATREPAGGERQPRRLHLPQRLRLRLAHLARAGYPQEACAILVGWRRGGAAWVRQVQAAENLEADGRRRFLLDPDAFVAADLAAREAGLEVLGFWHTHPDHLPLPSETDRAAAWEGYSYLIQAVTAAGPGELRSWRLEGSAFVEEELQPHLDARGREGHATLGPDASDASRPQPLTPSDTKEP